MRHYHAGSSVGTGSILLALSLGVLVSCATVSSAAPAPTFPEASLVASAGTAASPAPEERSRPTLAPGTAGEHSRDGSAETSAAIVPMQASAAQASPGAVVWQAPSPETSERADEPSAAADPPSPSSPEPTPGHEPTPTRTPIAASTPTLAPTPDPSPAATPSATVEPTPAPAAGATSSPELAAVPVTEAVEPAQPRLDAGTERKLRQVLRKMVSKKGVAGLQAAVLLPDGRMWLGAAGKAEYSPARPIADDTPFAIASVTKTFIAALILKLHEEGKLDIDEPFGRYEPLAPRGRRTTIRQLLSHTSGMYDYFEHPRYIKASGDWLRIAPAGVGDREHRWTYEEILGLVRAGYCKPGRCYRYSNTNYVILGKVAEKAGGAPLHEQLRERFFEPLEMRDTYYQPDEEPPLDAAHGHWPARGGGFDDHTRDARVIPFMAAASVASSAGAIASTARDLGIWADALYGGRVLSRGSLTEMTRILPDGTYGLGTDVAIFAGHLAYGHRGGLRGFEASMWHFPESGISVALLSNHGNWFTKGISIDQPVGKIVRAVLGRR